MQNSIESGSILEEKYTLPNLTNAKVVAKLNNCLDLIQTPMILEDEQAVLHTALKHKMDDLVETKRQDMPSTVSALDKVADESGSCVDSDNDETIASFWKKHQKEKSNRNKSSIEVDVSARKSWQELTPEKMVLEDDEEQRDCSVQIDSYWKSKGAKRIKKETLVSAS